MLSGSVRLQGALVSPIGMHLPQGMQRGGRGGAAGGPSVRGGFVPPFVRKALDAPGGKGAGKEEAEGPLSAKTLEMLAGPDGELPEVGVSAGISVHSLPSIASSSTRSHSSRPRRQPSGLGDSLNSFHSLNCRFNCFTDDCAHMCSMARHRRWPRWSRRSWSWCARRSWTGARR